MPPPVVAAGRRVPSARSLDAGPSGGDLEPGRALAAWCVRGLEPNLVEEGLVLHVAERLARGEHLYRDVVFFTGPLPFELLAGLFRIFGAEIAVGRTFMVGVQGAATGLAFAFARRAGAGPFAHAAAAFVAASPLFLFPLLSLFYYTPLALHLSNLAAFAALLGITTPAWAVVAGALGGAVALCKQTLGVMLSAALLGVLVGMSARGTRTRRALAFLGGGMAAAAVTLLAFAARGDLAALVRWLVVVPLSLESQYNSPIINFWPPGEIAPELLGNKALYLPNHWFQLYGILTRVTPCMVLATQGLYALPFVALAVSALVRLVRPLPAARVAERRRAARAHREPVPARGLGSPRLRAAAGLCAAVPARGADRSGTLNPAARRDDRGGGVRRGAARERRQLRDLVESCVGEPELWTARSAAPGQRRPIARARSRT